jgi:Cu+-exporting ATPase
MVKDLVCGMEIKEEEAAASSVYKGKKYYFCSKICKKKFDETPEKYIESEEKEKKSSPEEDESSPEEEDSSPAEEKPLPETEKRSAEERAPQAKSERIDLPIMGMSCASCASTIQRGLAGLKGVEKANV